MCFTISFKGTSTLVDFGWDVGEPNAGMAEQCLLIRGPATNVLHDVVCVTSSQHHVMCEVPVIVF